MKTRLIICVFLLGIVGCDNEADTYKQNLELKSKLQGSWFLEAGTSNTMNYRLLELEFIANNMRWYDSLVTESWTQRTRGSNPVVYSFNDGIVRTEYGTVYGSMYLKIDVNEVLWVEIGKSQTDKYNMDTLTRSGDMKISGTFPIRSSTVEFDSSLNVVEFCHPIGFTDNLDCYTFQRVDK